MAPCRSCACSAKSRGRRAPLPSRCSRTSRSRSTHSPAQSAGSPVIVLNSKLRVGAAGTGRGGEREKGHCEQYTYEHLCVVVALDDGHVGAGMYVVRLHAVSVQVADRAHPVRAAVELDLVALHHLLNRRAHLSDARVDARLLRTPTTN